MSGSRKKWLRRDLSEIQRMLYTAGNNFTTLFSDS